VNFYEGQAVSYVGDGQQGLSLGDHGRLLAFASKTAGHIHWLDGNLRGQVTVHELGQEVLPASNKFTAAQDGLEDSLEVGPVQHTSARSVYDTEGSAGVLSMLASAGHMANFEEIADDVHAFAQQRIRQEASFREVLAQLDDYEQDELVVMASKLVLRDALGATNDEN
jgi:hypothetical protein